MNFDSMINQIIGGDCLEVMKDIPDNLIDSCCTDPPYGLKFMNKKWDYDVPTADIWREVLRILKPGAHLLSFGGTRTYHRMVVNIEDAGFIIRDQIQWLYGSGFPKNHNLGNGIGTALKPANEPICLAMKPISEKTIAANVLKWGTGGINVDESRIEGEEPHHNYGRTSGDKAFCGKSGKPFNTPDKGRWPANVIMDKEAGEILNKQSGFLMSGARTPTGNKNKFSGNVYMKSDTPDKSFCDSSEGGASRFFYCPKASPSERELIGGDFEEKETTDGRNKPIDNPYNRGKTKRRNTHPTVKPLDLIVYLTRLITPPKGIVIDPYAGSGPLAIAAYKLNNKFICIEKEKESVKIAYQRLMDEKAQLDLFK